MKIIPAHHRLSKGTRFDHFLAVLTFDQKINAGRIRKALRILFLFEKHEKNPQGANLVKQLLISCCTCQFFISWLYIYFGEGGAVAVFNATGLTSPAGSAIDGEEKKCICLIR